MKILLCLFGHHEWKVGRRIPVINKDTGKPEYLCTSWCVHCAKRKTTTEERDYERGEPVAPLDGSCKLK